MLQELPKPPAVNIRVEKKKEHPHQPVLRCKGREKLTLNNNDGEIKTRKFMISWC